VLTQIMAEVQDGSPFRRSYLLDLHRVEFIVDGCVVGFLSCVHLAARLRIPPTSVIAVLIKIALG
jgi:hypothetical protein